MEIIIDRMRTWRYTWFFRCIFFLLLAHSGAFAQAPVKIYTVKKGRMYIELSKSLSMPALDSFITQFNLSDLAIKKFVKENNADSIKINGWEFDKNDATVFAISKPMLSSDNIDVTTGHFDLSVADRFPAAQSGLVMGSNKFKKKGVFLVKDSVVRFFLRNHLGSKQVMLAGSFNNFSPTALPMQQTDSGWTTTVTLAPGKYWYKFVADGKWMVDEANLLRENDDNGNTNSVYYKTNTRFQLSGYGNARKVFLAGSFNNWQPNKLLMDRTEMGWELSLYLAEGTYTYRFIADQNWFADPGNPERLRNEFGEFNSVVRKGTPYLFKLSGFTDAKKMVLMGSFNGWRNDELFMNKTESGWELPYNLGPGNYEYRFIPDGSEITDPLNPSLTNNDRRKANSILVLGANHIFRLKGFENAKTVYLAGDFNNFNETGFAMRREKNEWVFTVHLSPGKHCYKFVVDGQWMLDPENKLWEQNEYSTGNSIIWIRS